MIKDLNYGPSTAIKYEVSSPGLKRSQYKVNVQKDGLSTYSIRGIYNLIEVKTLNKTSFNHHSNSTGGKKTFILHTIKVREDFILTIISHKISLVK